MYFLTHNLLPLKSQIRDLKSQNYSSLAFFFEAFEAFFAAGFSSVASAASFFAVARFARGAAAAPPRLRCLLSASFSGFFSAPSESALPVLPGSGRASLLNEIVT